MPIELPPIKAWQDSTSRANGSKLKNKLQKAKCLLTSSNQFLRQGLKLEMHK